MDIILFNIIWMSWNIFLAFAGVFFGFMLVKSKKLFLKIPLFILWFLFVPNTIYLITDMQYIPNQLAEIENQYKNLLLLQYLFLFFAGIFTFIAGIYPLDKLLSKNKDRQLKIFSLFLINYLIAFGVALGRFERVNSWEVFTDLEKVIVSSLALLNSKEIMLLIFLFGSLSTMIYFLYKKIVKITV